MRRSCERGINVSFESRREASINGSKKGANIEGIWRAVVGARKRERYVMAVGRILQPVSPILETRERKILVVVLSKHRKHPAIN